MREMESEFRKEETVTEVTEEDVWGTHGTQRVVPCGQLQDGRQRACSVRDYKADWSLLQRTIAVPLCRQKWEVVVQAGCAEAGCFQKADPHLFTCPCDSVLGNYLLRSLPRRLTHLQSVHPPATPRFVAGHMNITCHCCLRNRSFVLL